MARILFLAHRTPWPPNKGDKIRAWHMLRHLAADHDVRVFSFSDEDQLPPFDTLLDAPALSAPPVVVKRSKFSQKLFGLKGFLTGQSLSVAAYQHSTMTKKLEAVFQHDSDWVPDLIWVYSGAMMGLLPEAAKQLPIVLDLVDVDSEKWAAYANNSKGIMRWVYGYEAEKLAEFEKKAVGCSIRTLLVSEQEADLFRTKLPPNLVPRVKAVKNGVDTDSYDPLQFTDPIVPGRVLFTGAMDYPPNIEAVEWFCENMLPRVRSIIGDHVHFRIAGSPVPANVQALDELPGVDVIGRVPDMREEISKAQVSVAPMRTARGIQNKVLEAMAMARPVVTTPEGFEGIAAREGLDLLVGADDIDFVAKVVALLQLPGAADDMGRRGRKAVQNEHDWDQCLRPVCGMIDQLTGQMHDTKG